MILVVAPNHRHAQHWAEREQRLQRREWRYVSSGRDLRGWRKAGIVVLLDSPGSIRIDPYEIKHAESLGVVERIRSPEDVLRHRQRRCESQDFYVCPEPDFDLALLLRTTDKRIDKHLHDPDGVCLYSPADWTGPQERTP